MGFLANIAKKLFGSANERLVKSLHPVVTHINSLAPDFEKLSDGDLRGKTEIFRKRLADGATLDDLLPEAFAAVREAGRRYLGMRHYDVQLIGGNVLHRGMIAEMVTGEGKTLVATLPAYLNALAGKGVHVVTVNDYLAQRDCDWMAPIYRGLGLSAGAIQSSMSSTERQPHYAADITYGTNNEFGFDYLRDNMKSSLSLQVQGPLHYAIVDEVDSILIDEARTPLIISGSSAGDSEKYREADRVVRQLGRPEAGSMENRFFKVEEKEHRVDLSEEGQQKVSELLGIDNIWAGANMAWPHLINNALKSHHLYKREKEYDIKDGEVKIVDEFTGRIMEGRRWSDGLHQAIEAKEERDGSGVRIREEQQTLATITLQNYFKLYSKLSGMTGTAMTEAGEFYKIYKLEVVDIPTNRRLIRRHYHDLVFGTIREKYESMAEEIANVSTLGRPVLVGTTSIERSSEISKLLSKRGFKLEHLPKAEGDEKRQYVLNARVSYENQYLEADIVAQAGRRLVPARVSDELATFADKADRASVGSLLAGVSEVGKRFRHAPGMVIIATNMAGRGTDILLGGNPGHFFFNHLRGEQGMIEAERKQAEKKAKKGKGDTPMPEGEVPDLFSDLHGILSAADALPYPMRNPAELDNPKEVDGVRRALAEAFQGMLGIHDGWFAGLRADEGKQLFDGLLDPGIYEAFFDDEAGWTDSLSDFFGRTLTAGNDLGPSRRFVVDLLRLSIPIDTWIDRHLAIRRDRLAKGDGDRDTAWVEALGEEVWRNRLRQAEHYMRDCLFNRLLVVCPQFFNTKQLGLEDARPGESGSLVPYWFEAHTSGGLAIVGTERHESRRIDNQLRGRCGRQGDPGTSQFFLALEDDLMRMFAGPRVRKVLAFAGLKEGQPIQAGMVTKSVERAQKRVEQRNFEVRKNLLEYDEVMDRQRKTIYTLRQGVLEGLTHETDPLRFRTLRVKRSVREQMAGSDPEKLDYDEWHEWWEHETADPTPLAEEDDWEPVVPPLRERHLHMVSMRMLHNRISRVLDDYSHPEHEAREWDATGFAGWFNEEFGKEAEPIDEDDVTGLALADLRSRLEERVLWERDPNLESIPKEAKGMRKDDLRPFAETFADNYGMTLDEDDIARIDALQPKKAPEFFTDLYRERCRRRRENEIGRQRLQLLDDRIVQYTGGWDLDALTGWLKRTVLLDIEPKELVGKQRDDAEEHISDRVEVLVDGREEKLGKQMVRFIEQFVLLQTIDARWKDHLKEMDYLRSAVAFAGMAQRDPKVEYKIRGLDLFRQMLELVENNFGDKLLRARLVKEDSLEELGSIWGAGEARKDAAGGPIAGAPQAAQGGDATRGEFDRAANRPQGEQGPVETIQREHRRVKPNEPCPCGSGKKYKKCHGLPGAGPLPKDAMKKLKA